MESDEVARVTAYARDAHLACAWSHLCRGRTVDQVVDELNAWFGTSHSMATWTNRRRRGALLLHFPSLAYQSVLPLDGTVLSMRRIADLIESHEQLSALNGELMREYRSILGGSGEECQEEYHKIAIPEGSVGIVDHDDRHSTLHRWGYQVFPIELSIGDDVVDAFHDIPKRKFHAIFNNASADSDANDALRSQLDFDNVLLSSGVFSEFRQSVEQVLKQRCPNHEIRGMAVLRSEADCEAQLPHADYLERPGDLPASSSSSSWYDWSSWDHDANIPLGCLVALQDDTLFDVWPEAIRFDRKVVSQCRTLQLKRGDVVLFRGDLVHAGAAFEELNIRVHCYLEPKRGAFPRPKERDGTEQTQLISPELWPNILPRGCALAERGSRV